jgi:hypothetical protein
VFHVVVPVVVAGSSVSHDPEPLAVGTEKDGIELDESTGMLDMDPLESLGRSESICARANEADVSATTATIAERATESASARVILIDMAFLVRLFCVLFFR